MTAYQILPTTRKQVRWVVGREFVHLPAVDPAFAPENMKLLRRLILRYMILPTNYMQQATGFILHIDEQPAGYIFLRPRTRALRVDSLAVEPEYRRQGYASKMLAHAEGVAAEKALDFLSATLNPENRAANALAEKFGFQPYRAEGWTLSDPARLLGEDPASKAGLRELSPADLIPAYERWMAYELKHGDAWAEEIVSSEYPRMALRTRARHWACLLDGEEVGYLRISGLRGRFTAYLASEKTTWAGQTQLAWLSEAAASYPVAPRELLLDLASSGHDQASAEVLRGAGFGTFDRPRYLIFKSLKEK